MRWDTRQWAGSLITSAVLVIGLVCLRNGSQRVGKAFPGFLLAENRIVVSIGRPDWSQQLDNQIPFSQVVEVVGSPAASAAEIQAHAEGLPPGSPVTYRFRKQAEVFSATVPTRLFTRADFFALYGNYFVVGLTFAMAGLWALVRLEVRPPATHSFFLLCQIVALALLAAGDVYGPYWFTDLYFAAQCITPVALLHFASSFPETLGRGAVRIVALGMVYAASVALAIVVNLVSDSPSLFLPLVYTVYLLLANSILLYLARLLMSRSSTADSNRRRVIDLAVVAVVLALSLPAAIFVVYPVIKGFISPVVLVLPLALFPLVTAAALYRAARLAPIAALGSVRLRLSFLFLAAVETAFLAGIAYFWLSNSWQQLLDDLAIHQRQQARLEVLRPDEIASAEDLAGLAASLDMKGSDSPIQGLLEALGRGDVGRARESIAAMSARYLVVGEGLETRRRWLGRMDAAMAISLVLVGVLQAVVFTVAVRRWLIQPIDHLASATAVIATGDLSHRSSFDSSEEFASLAQSINTMAASLASIQQRVSAERTARERAAAAARDAERRRLARELHDGVMQDLSAVKLAVEGEAKRAGQEGMQGVVDGLIRLIVSLRRVVDDLRPQDLSHVSLGEAIGNNARALALRHGIRMDLDVAGAGDVGEWAARDVYRIAQEAVTNAVRHGSPSQITVRFLRRGDDTVLEIVDDGTGFDPRRVVRGSGLAGMEERAAALGGQLELRSTPGSGTALSLVIPPSQVPGDRAPE